METALERAADSGVKALVTIGTDIPTSRAAAEMANRYPAVWAAVGVHPHDAESFDDAAARSLAELAVAPRVAAIGEVGLDFYRNLSSPQDQQKAFLAQIEIAKRAEKPLIMHVRDAYEEVFELLERVGPPEMLVFHCFSGTAAQARRAVDLGGFVSFAGNVSFRNAESLRDAARAVPLRRLLVETDSPYLAPMPFRGKPNEPAYVVHVGEALAAARDEPVDLIAEATTENATAVLSLVIG